MEVVEPVICCENKRSDESSGGELMVETVGGLRVHGSIELKQM